MFLQTEADVLNLCERLAFAGVRVCFIAQGVDSEDKTFQVLLMARGMIDQLFLSDTATRVRCGMEGNLARGLHTGGHCYGYTLDGPESQRRAAIEPAEAAVVRRLFEEYAAGDSLKTIGKRFNAEGVRLDAARENMASIRQRREHHKKRAANLTEAVARLGPKPELLDKLAAEQRALDALSDEVLTEGNGLDAHLAEMQTFVSRRMKDLPAILRGGDGARAKLELAKHCREIVITPAGDSYRLNGKWDLLGNQPLRTAGGGGRDATVQLPVRFAWRAA